ncbi:DUF3108 domain-containing protein [Gammaproteobacteria bacterium]|nr:DUF3108 domain-containing protein [Gammaproteobacteria bacterium]|tara:strand:- start:305 stop:1087 length:783 start_codon:yes stop_codon:yes gene_type:complete
MTSVINIVNQISSLNLLGFVRIFLIIIAATFLTSVYSSDLLSYSASYSAKYNGMDITAKYQLEQLDVGTYLETSEAKSIFGKITEKAQFELTAFGQIVPRNYQYKRSLMGVSRREEQLFDWDNSQLIYTKNGTQKIVPLAPNSLDLITHKLQIRRDLEAGKTTFSYPVMSRDRPKQYDYEVLTKEIVTTALGPLNTTKLRRVVKQDKKRETVIWLADDWAYLIVKLSHSENDDNHQLNITSGQVAGRDIAPLKMTQENQL